jgi:hypothetical protein
MNASRGPSAANRDRLAKLLSLLSSDHTGERDNVAIAAHRLPRGVTWFDVINSTSSDRQLPERNLPWRTTVPACLRRPGDQRAWERGFLASLASLPRQSTKQIAQRALRRRMQYERGGAI